MNRYAIIVAGGVGNRMGNEQPKQFMLISGKPMLMYSIEAFAGFDRQLRIIVPMHPDHIESWNSLCRQYAFTIPHHVVPGGSTRYHSVKNGLETIKGDGLVAVHDGARPVVSNDFISRCFSEASVHGNAIPGIPVNETVRYVTDQETRIIDRSSLRIMQTPQVFDVEILRKAYTQEYRPEFTDDASLLESLGIPVYIIPGEFNNIKVTLPGDDDLAGFHIQRLSI